MKEQTITQLRVDRLRAYFAARMADTELVISFEEAVRADEHAKLRAVVAAFMEPRGIFAK